MLYHFDKFLKAVNKNIDSMDCPSNDKTQIKNYPYPFQSFLSDLCSDYFFKIFKWNIKG